jgi:hypothetical protein
MLSLHNFTKVTIATVLFLVNRVIQIFWLLGGSHSSHLRQFHAQQKVTATVLRQLSLSSRSSNSLSSGASSGSVSDSILAYGSTKNTKTASTTAKTRRISDQTTA